MLPEGESSLERRKKKKKGRKELKVDSLGPCRSLLFYIRSSSSKTLALRLLQVVVVVVRVLSLLLLLFHLLLPKVSAVDCHCPSLRYKPRAIRRVPFTDPVSALVNASHAASGLTQIFTLIDDISNRCIIATIENLQSTRWPNSSSSLSSPLPVRRNFIY